MTDSEANGGSLERPGGPTEERDDPRTRLVEAVERNVERLLDDVVDQALERIADDDERELVREGVAARLRETLSAVADDEARRRGIALPAPMTTDGLGPEERAIDVASRVEDIGFVEFTTDLINGTFDALVNSTIRQMEAYADLLREASMTLSEFRETSVGDAEIDAHLSDRYPDDDGGTVVRPSYTFTKIEADEDTGRPERTAGAQLQAVAQALVLETRHNPEGQRLRLDDDPEHDERLLFGLDGDLHALAVDADASAQFELPHVKAVRTAIAYSIANGMLERLQEMVAQGMSRIVVSEGEIFTRLTFEVESTDSQKARETEFRRNRFGGGLRVGGRARNILGTLGLRGGGGLGGSRLRITTANESQTAGVDTNIEMYGHVRVNFKSDYFPAAEIHG